MSLGVCFRCDEPVLETEPHEVTLVATVFGEPAHKVPVHWECSARAVLGSVGHQGGKCSCYGGTEEDPPDMTRRQAAAAALKLAMSRAAGEGWPWVS